MRLGRRAQLWAIAAALALVALLVWGVGVLADISLLRFAGFMVGACTFVPLPADAWVLHAATDNPAIVIGLVGGAINALVVLVEREWVLRFIDHPSFDTFKRFVGTNRAIEWAERYLFTGLVVGGFSFLPFEPFRLLAVMKDYPRWRYALATFTGRGFRYYWLARLGGLFAGLGLIRAVVWASLALFTVGLFRSYREFARS